MTKKTVSRHEANRYGVTPKPRLLRALARHLERNVTDRRFDMYEWCGTARCAMGHAPSVPAIRATGLRIRYDGGGPQLTLRKADEAKIAATKNIHIDNIESFDRACFVFGITYSEAELLFSGSYYSRSYVAQRLRAVAAEYEGRSA